MQIQATWELSSLYLNLPGIAFIFQKSCTADHNVVKTLTFATFQSNYRPPKYTFLFRFDNAMNPLHVLSEKKVCCFENSTTFPPLKKTLGVRAETNIPKNSKAIIMLALCPGRCLLHHKGIEYDQTIFFHVTAGNVKFAIRE